MSPLERLLLIALERGDRVASIGLAQRLWHPGDLRRTAVVGLLRGPGLDHLPSTKVTPRKT